MSILESTEYFNTVDLDESVVVKFEYSTAKHEVCIIVHPFTPPGNCIESPERPSKVSCEYPYEVFHKLVFSDAANYKRSEPTYEKYKNMEAYEDCPGSNSPLLMYSVENTNFPDKEKFSAVLSEFGEVSFNYSKLDIESKIVIGKWLEDKKGRIYVEVGTGKIGMIPELFESNGFRIGDTVHLKSGGPEMTVNSLKGQEKDGLVNCIWFDGSNVKHSDEFQIAMLETTQVLPQNMKSISG